MRKFNASIMTGGVLVGALFAGMLATAPGAQAAPVIAATATTTTYPVIATVAIGIPVSDGMAIDSAHQTAYVLNTFDDTVSVVDLTSNTVTDTLVVGDYPFRVAIDAGLNRAYVSNTFGRSISVIDTATRAVIRTIPLPDEPRGIAVDPGTHKLHVAFYQDFEALAEIDPSTEPATIARSGYLGSRPWAVAVDPTTHKAYVVNLFGGELSEVSGTTIDRNLGWFPGPTQVEADPANRRAYVVSGWGVSVVDLDTSVVTGLAAGTRPSDIAWDASIDTAYVSDYNDNTVSVIDRSTDAIIATVPVGVQPVAVDVDPATHRVYVLNSDATVSVIAPLASQEITFTSLPPTAARVGGSYTVSATGGASGRPVTFSVDATTTNSACSVTGDVVSFDHAGSCVIAADQASDMSNYAAAATVTQQVSVTKVPTSATITLSSIGVVHGQSATASVAVSGTHDGSVQFRVDGTPLGAPVALDTDGEATAPDLAGLAVGAHQLGADFTPTDANTYAASNATPKTLTVSKAATTSSVSVSANTVTATVSPVAPGAGVPTGTVRFSVSGAEIGTAQLTGGTASLAHRVPTGSARQVSVVYAGDSAFTGSSVSTARRDPLITATVSSAKARHNGWYSGPVTVTFHCTATSAALTATCPAPVTLTHDAAGQSVTRTVIAADGGAATVAVRGINIDTVRPVVRVTGVRAGATYFVTGPVAHCRAGDTLSGIASCTVTRTTRGAKVVYVATATDSAGNRRSTRLTALITKVTITGAPMRGGDYVVHGGRTYMLLVASKTRPTYVHAALAPHRPAGGNAPFYRVGKDRWAIGVTFTDSMSRHPRWNIGTRVGSHTTVTTVRVQR